MLRSPAVVALSAFALGALIAVAPATADAHSWPTRPSPLRVHRPLAAPPRVYRPLAGSSKFLVYASLALTDSEPSRSGRLEVRDRDGKTRTLADLRVRDDAEFWLAGSTLVADLKPGARARWWNLSTGRSGRTTDTDVVAAAPGGWISSPHPVGDDSYKRVLYQHVFGRSPAIKLGTPDPDGTYFDLSTGPRVLVAYSDFPESSNGSAQVMRFSDPGVFHRLIKRRPDATVTCASSTAKYVACTSASTKDDSERLYNIGCKLLLTTTKHCPLTDSAVDGSALAWRVEPENCGVNSGRIEIASQNGTRRTVDHHVGPGTPIAAWHEVVVGAHAMPGHTYQQLELVSPSGGTTTLEDLG